MRTHELMTRFGTLIESLNLRSIKYEVRVMPYGHTYLKILHPCGCVYYVDRDSIGEYVEVIEGRIRLYYKDYDRDLLNTKIIFGNI